MTAYLNRLLPRAGRPAGIQPRPRSRYEPEPSHFPGGGLASYVETFDLEAFDDISGEPPRTEAGQQRSGVPEASRSVPGSNPPPAVNPTTSAGAELGPAPTRFIATSDPHGAPVGARSAAAEDTHLAPTTAIPHHSEVVQAVVSTHLARRPEVSDPVHIDAPNRREETSHPIRASAAITPDTTAVSPAIPTRIRLADKVNTAPDAAPPHFEAPAIRIEPSLASAAGIQHAVAAVVAEPARAEPTEIVVHIDRIDVHSGAASAARIAAEPRQARATPTSLESYLRNRSRGGR